MEFEARWLVPTEIRANCDRFVNVTCIMCMCVCVTCAGAVWCVCFVSMYEFIYFQASADGYINTRECFESRNCDKRID